MSAADALARATRLEQATRVMHRVARKKLAQSQAELADVVEKEASLVTMGASLAPGAVRFASYLAQQLKAMRRRREILRDIVAQCRSDAARAHMQARTAAERLRIARRAAASRSFEAALDERVNSAARPR